MLFGWDNNSLKLGSGIIGGYPQGKLSSFICFIISLPKKKKNHFSTLTEISFLYAKILNMEEKNHENVHTVSW